MKHHKIRTGIAISMILAGFLMACGNTGNTDTEKLRTNTPLYNLQQQLFCLTMLSNLSNQYSNSDSIQDSTAAALNKVLADAATIQYIGNWQCVWGPVVFTDPSIPTRGVAANTMFIAQQTGTTNFVVAIAGTNGSSYYDIFYEDLNAVPYVLWDSNDSTKGNVSTGMQLGLSKLQGMLSGGITASQFLVQNAATVAGAQVWVTGHSLGGTIGPMYALYLHDSMDYWAPKSDITVNCQIVAGASPGDSIFAAYYIKQMGSNTTRVWNTRDIVPHAFEMDMMKQVQSTTFYPQDSVGAMDGTIAADIDSLVSMLAEGNCTTYTQLQPDSTFSFTSAIYTTDSAAHTSPVYDTTFSNQWVLQHVAAYGVYFGTLGFQQAVQSVLGLPYPYFTDGAILVPVW